MEKISKFIVTIATAYYLILNPSYMIFGVLIVANILDYVTGIMRAISAGEKVTAQKAFNGIMSKLNKMIYVIVAMSADILITYNFVTDTTVTVVTSPVIMWLIINELVSICCNISNNEKINVPPMITTFLEKFKSQ